MSQKILQGIQPIIVSNDNLRELLLQGNIFQNDKKIYLKNVIAQIQNGNKQLYSQFVTVIILILKQNNNNQKTKQIAYDHITELAVTANYQLINDLNRDLFSRIPEFYDEKDCLGDYITLWKQMYNGKNDYEDFPNLSKTLQKIQTQQSLKLTGKLAKFYTEFNKNMQKIKEKKVQFFQDFDDSSFSESFIDENRMTEIVYMDIMQLKEIRQRVQKQKLTEQNCAEYLIKMKTFLNLNSTSISGDLLKEFNKQKIWAKHFIDHHEEYLKRNLQQGNKPTSIANIYLSNEQQSMEIPEGNFHRGNFTIKQVPVDESRLTQKSSKKDIPLILNRSKVKRFESDYVIEKPHNYQKRNQANIYNRNSVNNMGYERKTFQQVSRPLPEQTLPFQESTLLNNLSIPVELANPMKLMMMKNPTNRFTQFPNAKYNNESIEYSNSKMGLSYSNNNPFANSKTKYNSYEQSNVKSQYQIYKQINKSRIDFHSPIRNRMSEDDLDSDNLGDDLIVKPHYYKDLAFSTNNKLQHQNKFTTTHYAKTQLNFYPPQDKFTLNLKSQQEICSQQLSPRSGRSNKKRLSQLTSQKKQRKTKGSRQNGLNSPQEYAFRPYSMHFRKDLQNFNNFRRNCLQQSFPVYINEDLVISCRLRKVKDSRVQVEIIYENQLREQLSMSILYKIPKSLKIQKVSKIHRKFNLDDVQSHKFNLRVAEFPLQMCFLQLTYSLNSEQDHSIVSSAHIPLPITIKNFIQTLSSNRQQWLKTLKRLTTQNFQEPYMIEKTFQIDRDVIDPSSLQNILEREFIKIGASEGYSVEQFGCICHYKEFNNMMFLLRIAVRVDHIATLSIITQNRLTNNQKDFLNYFIQILLTIFAKYSI